MSVQPQGGATGGCGSGTNTLDLIVASLEKIHTINNNTVNLLHCIVTSCHVYTTYIPAICT